MGQFGIALQMAFDEVGWSQLEAAEKSGVVSQPTIGRYLRGVTLPEPATLESLVSKMPDRVRENVVLAYLNDQVPPSAENRIRVEITGLPADRREDVIYGRAPAGSILRKDLEKLEKLALKNPNLAKTINYMVASLEGTLETSPYDEDPLSVQESAVGEYPEDKILARGRPRKRRES